MVAEARKSEGDETSPLSINPEFIRRKALLIEGWLIETRFFSGKRKETIKMTERKQNQPNTKELCSLRVEVIVAMNKLIEAKKIAPGSKWHLSTLRELAEIVARNPQALDELVRLQKDGDEKKEGE